MLGGGKWEVSGESRMSWQLLLAPTPIGFTCYSLESLRWRLVTLGDNLRKLSPPCKGGVPYLSVAPTKK